MLGILFGLALLGGAGYVGWRLAKGGSTLRMNPNGTIKSHDYDPAWDYELTEPDPEFREYAEEFAATPLVREVLDTMGLGSLELFYAQLGGPLGKYVNGTATAPVIGLDEDEIFNASSEADVDVRTGVESTILHELGHAFVDSLGYANVSPRKEEKAVERFAHDVWSGKGVRQSVDQLRAEYERRSKTTRKPTK